MNVIHYVTFFSFYGLKEYTVFCTVLSPTLTVGMCIISSGVSNTFFSLGHQHRYI